MVPGRRMPASQLELAPFPSRLPEGTVWALVGLLYPWLPICRATHGTTTRLWGRSRAAAAAPRSGVTAGRCCLACCFERVGVRDALVWVSIWLGVSVWCPVTVSPKSVALPFYAHALAF